MKKNKGFTLVELMVVLVIVAIFMAIAIPSYQRYMERRDLAIAKQESLRIASELERFKSKNFSYKGFDASFVYPDYDATTGELYLPVGTTATTAKYLLTLVDAEAEESLAVARDADGEETAASQAIQGLGWAMKVERMDTTKQAHNYDLLLRSNGLRCMTKTADVVAGFADCGTTGVESW